MPARPGNSGYNYAQELHPRNRKGKPWNKQDGVRKPQIRSAHRSANHRRPQQFFAARESRRQEASQRRQAHYPAFRRIRVYSRALR